MVENEICMFISSNCKTDRVHALFDHLSNENFSMKYNKARTLYLCKHRQVSFQQRLRHIAYLGTERKNANS